MLSENRRRSVYPSDWVYDLLGFKSSLLNEGLTAYAVALSRAVAENAESFLPHEWHHLWAYQDALEQDVTLPDQGHRMAENLLGATTHTRMGQQQFSAQIKMLAKKLRRLDYLHARAVLTVLESAAELPADEKWYTVDALSARRRAIKPKNA